MKISVLGRGQWPESHTNAVKSAYSRDSGWRLKSPPPEPLFSQYLRSYDSELFPAAVSLPVKASAAISVYAIFSFWLESWGRTRTKLEIAYTDIAALAFTGKDTAAGKSWESWV